MRFIIFSDKKDNEYTKRLSSKFCTKEKIKEYYLEWYGRKRQGALKDIDLKLIDKLEGNAFRCYEGHPRDCLISGLDIVFTSLVKVI